MHGQNENRHDIATKPEAARQPKGRTLEGGPGTAFRRCAEGGDSEGPLDFRPSKAVFRVVRGKPSGCLAADGRAGLVLGFTRASESAVSHPRHALRVRRAAMVRTAARSSYRCFGGGAVSRHVPGYTTAYQGEIPGRRRIACRPRDDQTPRKRSLVCVSPAREYPDFHKPARSNAPAGTYGFVSDTKFQKKGARPAGSGFKRLPITTYRRSNESVGGFQ